MTELWTDQFLSPDKKCLQLLADLQSESELRTQR